MSIVIQPLSAVNISLSKLATPKSFCVIPVALALVLADSNASLLCCIPAVAFTSALIILSALSLKSTVAPVPLLATTTLISEPASSSKFANSSIGPVLTCADTPPVVETTSEFNIVPVPAVYEIKFSDSPLRVTFVISTIVPVALDPLPVITSPAAKFPPVAGCV